MEAVSRRTAMLGAVGVAGAALVGCSTESNAQTPSPNPPAPTPSATPTPTVDTTPRWPLTGKVLKDPQDANHIAVAVKVPDMKNEHPQRGLDKADIVFVQLGGYRNSNGDDLTRLVPVFHSKWAEGVNPVRSLRPVDVPLLAPMGAIIGSTGGIAWVLKYVAAFGNKLETKRQYMTSKGTGAYSIDGGRVRTLNGRKYYDRAVVCHPKSLAKLSKRADTGPQQSYLPWASSADEVSTVNGKDASYIAVPYQSGNRYQMSYTWSEKSGRYLRSMPWGKHVLDNGKRVATDNVLVIKAAQLYGRITPKGKVTRGGHHPEPIHKIMNATGEFLYAHGGKCVTGTWSKGEPNEPFTFVLDDGTPLKMAPGQSFVELPNKNAKITIKG